MENALKKSIFWSWGGKCRLNHHRASSTFFGIFTFYRLNAKVQTLRACGMGLALKRTRSSLRQLAGSRVLVAACIFFGFCSPFLGLGFGGYLLLCSSHGGGLSNRSGVVFNAKDCIAGKEYWRKGFEWWELVAMKRYRIVKWRDREVA